MIKLTVSRSPACPGGSDAVRFGRAPSAVGSGAADMIERGEIAVRFRTSPEGKCHTYVIVIDR
eukprot:9482993-Pyramimonas_sp.AAC.2